ncbi:MAG: hypothetical protein OXI55_07130, partial [Gammaproteobacteria bacterium]|nr:hypothetical protein [Gammaproteobacteria bacterium]
QPNVAAACNPLESPMTAHPNKLQRLRHGQALALQYAAQVLINSQREPQIIRRVLSGAQLAATNAVSTTALGCTYAARMLLPFVVELALKALIAKHNNDQEAWGHRLSKLYDKLPPNVQVELERDFEQIRRTEFPVETRTARRILADHDNDFPEWRYLDDPSELVSGSVDTLQYVACGVLNVYNSR